MTEALARVRAWLAERELPALVATRPPAVAWLTGGPNPPIDRTAPFDTLWAVVTPTTALLLTTEVEYGRLIAEHPDPDSELRAVPWYDPAAPAVAAARFTGHDPALTASDGHPAFGVDATDDLVALRLALTPGEQDALRALGTDATAAVEDALDDWRPGDRDRDVQAAIAAGVERAGADAPVLIVGGDERLRHRHPLAVGAPLHRTVMAVLVARRGGLHVALTRFAGDAPDRTAVRAIEAGVLAASRPGRSYGDALTALDRAYTAAGHPGGWRQHYQGGPIGYAQREFEIAPGQTDSRWYRQPIALGHALAWNPSLPGGAKAEDTYLLTDAGPERVTTAPPVVDRPATTERPVTERPVTT
ncbi:M24 family metallopeptidase [Kitasatospora sp. NPDC092286]|uniref:M24 family metallopeptidase n=1 Tax=Kitasatospora sp. NPDC092286 TaxID=3364087 RepID=UPI00382CD853